MAAKAMLTIKLDPEHASLDEVRKRLDLKPEEIDQHFGLVGVDPSNNVYALLVDHERASSISDEVPDVSGPFSNPKIEPADLSGDVG